jgi:hypothetical protein
LIAGSNSAKSEPSAPSWGGREVGRNRLRDGRQVDQGRSKRRSRALGLIESRPLGSGDCADPQAEDAKARAPVAVDGELAVDLSADAGDGHSLRIVSIGAVIATASISGVFARASTEGDVPAPSKNGEIRERLGSTRGEQ